jgi:rhodanese-related sulfurtransferase
MPRSLWRQDLAWAAFLLLLASVFGILEHWHLVRLSVQGELPGYLEKLRNRQRQVQFQGVKTLNLAQAHTLWKEGHSLFIDARSPQEYGELHIPGAINLPPEKLQQLGAQAVAEFARDRQIVVYCGTVACDSALKVAEMLQSYEFTRVMAFLGGFRAWDEAGYPVDTSQ